MTDTPAPTPKADTREGIPSENRPAPAAGLLAAALAPGRSYHERQRELVHASLIAPWVPDQTTHSPRA